MQKKKYESPSLFKHTERDRSIRRLKARGYSEVTLSNNCILLQKITSDNYVQQVQVDYTGRIRKYKPWKPSPHEKATLSKVAEASRRNTN